MPIRWGLKSSVLWLTGGGSGGGGNDSPLSVTINGQTFPVDETARKQGFVNLLGLAAGDYSVHLHGTAKDVATGAAVDVSAETWFVVAPVLPGSAAAAAVGRPHGELDVLRSLDVATLMARRDDPRTPVGRRRLIDEILAARG